MNLNDLLSGVEYKKLNLPHKLEVDRLSYDSRKISAEINEDSLIINAMSPIHLINEMNKKNTRTVRNRVRITKDTGDKEEIILITVRVHDCIRGKV